MEREQYQTEIRDLQDQLSEMHDELDSAKKSASDEEKDAIMAVRHLPHYSGKKKISVVNHLTSSNSSSITVTANKHIYLVTIKVSH